MRKALVVGINYYAKISGLFGCVNDARQVANVLEWLKWPKNKFLMMPADHAASRAKYYARLTHSYRDTIFAVDGLKKERGAIESQIKDKFPGPLHRIVADACFGSKRKWWSVGSFLSPSRARSSR